MTMNRRNFLVASAAGAAGAIGAAGCADNQPQPQAESQPQQQQQAAVRIQLSGLIMHARKPPVDANNRHAYQGWDALLVRSHSHHARLRIPLANVKNAQPYNKDTNPRGYQIDRINPDIAVWNIEDREVLVNLDGKVGGTVTGVSGKRQVVDGKLAACPTAGALPGDPQFEDITWMADLDLILGDGLLAEGLEGDLRAHYDARRKAEQESLITGRVVLPEGSMACAAPSLEGYEQLMIGYTGVTTNYPAQFTADLLRLTSLPAAAVSLELKEILSTSTQRLDLQPIGKGPIPVFIENHDPTLPEQALSDTLTRANYWAHHFSPYLKLLRTPPAGGITPVIRRCSGGAEPPYYCVPPGGRYR